MAIDRRQHGPRYKQSRSKESAGAEFLAHVADRRPGVASRSQSCDTEIEIGREDSRKLRFSEARYRLGGLRGQNHQVYV